jgi:hypothetical protein
MRLFSVHRISSGGGALYHIGITVSIATYVKVAPAHRWVSPESPVHTEIVGGAAAKLVAEHHRWEEAVSIFRTWTTLEEALKNKLARHLNQCTLQLLTMPWLGSLSQLQET